MKSAKDWGLLDMTYKFRKVHEVIDEIAMGPFGSNIKVDCFVPSGVPVLNGSNLSGFVLGEESFNYVTPEKATSLNKAVASRGDVVITHRGTLGQIVYIPGNSKFERYVISQSQFRVRCKVTEMMPEFMVYFFHSREGQHKLLSNSSQVGVPALARPSSTFQELEMPVPTIDEQQKIVGVLSALDARIAENRKINHHLEQMAQAIFKSWFTDFEPIKPFTEIVQVLGGGTPKTGTGEYWNGDIPFFTPKDTLGIYILTTEKTLTEAGLSKCNSRLYPVNTVFVTARGTVGKLALAGRPMAMNQSCYALIGTDGFGQHYVYHLAQYVVERLKHKASGAVFDAIVTRDFESELVPAVTAEDARAFEEKVDPIYEAILNNSNENIRLSELRDALLSRLMSGELSVADLDDAK
jgi:type I restriction enzyme S subunit